MIQQLQNYTIDKLIGEGSYAQVFLGKHKITKEQVAIKQIRKPDNSQMENVDREMAVLLTLENPNIIKLIESEDTQFHIYLILEFCSLGDLQYLLDKNFKNKGFPEDLVQLFIQQLQYACIEMQSKGIIHRDLKLSNILMNHKMETKIADFGFAKYQEYNKNLQQSRAGTPLTMAPEVLKCEDYNEKCDIWSLGIIIYQMVFGVVPFDPGQGKGEISLLKLIDRLKDHPLEFPQNKEISKELKNLITDMLKYNPEDRITLEQLINDQWVNQQIDQKEIIQKYQDYFQIEENNLDLNFQINFGKQLRNYIDNNVNSFLQKLSELVQDLQKLDNLEMIGDILSQVRLFLDQLEEYTFEINNEKIHFHRDLLNKIKQFKSELPQGQIFKEKEDKQLENKSGILGIPNNFMKNMLKILGISKQNQIDKQQNNQQDQLSQSQEKRQQKVSLEMCNFMINQEENYKIIEQIQIQGIQQRRINNINISQAYHYTGDNAFQVINSNQNENILSNQSHQSHQSNQHQQQPQQQHQFYHNLNDIIQQSEQEQVEQIELDEENLFEFEDEEQQHNNLDQYNNTNNVNDQLHPLQLNKQQISYKEELNEEQIKFNVVKFYSPFYNEQELENIKLIQSFCNPNINNNNQNNNLNKNNGFAY